MGQVFEEWQHEYANEQVSDLNRDMVRTRADRIRAAMFPETLDDGSSFVSTQYETGEATCVQKLAQPSQLLKEAIVMLIHYKDDVDVTAIAIPELIKLLQDPDRGVARQAAGTVFQLAKKEAPRHALIESPDLIPAIVKVLTTNDDPETVKALAGTLTAISGSKKGLLSIFRSGGIPALVKMLSSPVEKVVHYSLTTLHNILQHQGDDAKRAVRLAGGVQKMVDLLSKDNAPLRMLALLTDCLEMLSFQHQESKLIIVSKHGTQQLIRILQHNADYEKLLFTTCRLLKVLSVETSNKQVIIECNGMNILGAMLDNPSNRVVMNCLWTLRNLSDQATKEEGLDDLLQRSVRLLESNDVGIVMCCVGILSNLTCNNARNKALVCHFGGVQALVQTMLQAVERDDITEPAICALRHLTSRHEQAKAAQEAVRHGIPTLVKLLGPDSHYPLVKAVIGLCRNLGIGSANQQYLRDAGAIPKLIELLFRADGEMSRGYRDDDEDGVVPEDVAEGSTGALHVLARDPMNRQLIRQSNVIPTVVRFLSSPNGNMQRSAAGLLCELATDKEAADQIEAQNATVILQPLLHSANECVATYAAATMYRMSEDKPHDIRKRLSQELTNSLFRPEDLDDHYNNDEAIFRTTRPIFGMVDAQKAAEKAVKAAGEEYEKQMREYEIAVEKQKEAERNIDEEIARLEAAKSKPKAILLKENSAILPGFLPCFQRKMSTTNNSKHITVFTEADIEMISIAAQKSEVTTYHDEGTSLLPSEHRSPTAMTQMSRSGHQTPDQQLNGWHDTDI
ncbi:Oidioi.mRNA.OKI2018_I69.chr1.g1687.t2.cds [Oikopleura dioica]|uniref:Oidioi.mRNA.OKI2018_I69.chr1.g1687.t2.cds n=1 Tax=Oikopleura dioica TaxID=34765 RepID=A0ABN7SUZ4_OIKDI|nr:Oidioi.mRNA.OKI2018_I69.chr1.g1687.t2.cds [Oikopleura dioica]